MAYLNYENQELAIFQIQRILRDLELIDNDLSKVPISGVYDDATREAIISFQNKYSLEPNGRVDLETWNLLKSLNDSLKYEINGVRSVQLVPKNEYFSIIPNEKNDIVYVIQYFLTQISQHYDDFEVLEYTGIYDIPTQNAIKAFQRKNLIDATGIIDAETLERLFDEYESVISQEN